MNLRRLFDLRQWRISRRRALREIDEEFDFHLQHRAHDSEAEGLAPADARHDADPHSGWVWDTDGVAHELPPLPGDIRSKASGINEAGQAVGHSRSDTVHIAVIWR